MISVCMTTYNGARYIKEQLQTIKDQTRCIDEMVICDDGSADDTVKIIQDFIQRNNLEDKWRLYCNTENRGYPGNFYYAMSLCNGDIIFLADQDDVWKEYKIDKMAQVMEQHEEISLLASKWAIINQSGEEVKAGLNIQSISSEDLRKISLEEILYKYEWPGMAMCFRKSLMNDLWVCSGYNTVAHDVALALCATEIGGFYFYNEVCQYHRRHDNNVAMEENRIGKLLNKSRKLVEIDRYIELLESIINSTCIRSLQALEKVQQKKDIMVERKKNLLNGNRRAIWRQYCKNRDNIRMETAVCDWIICKQKKISSLEKVK